MGNMPINPAQMAQLQAMQQRQMSLQNQMGNEQSRVSFHPTRQASARRHSLHHVACDLTQISKGPLDGATTTSVDASAIPPTTTTGEEPAGSPGAATESARPDEPSV